MDAPDSLRSPGERRAEGRPEDGLSRTVLFPIRLTPAERKRLGELAGERGLNVATYVRAAALGAPLPPARPVAARLPEVNVDTYRQLGWIGNNLNQLARAFNLRDGEDPTGAEVLAELHRLMGAVRELQRLLRGWA